MSEKADEGAPPVRDPLWMREDWKADCIKWRGEVLKGEYAHWCDGWDGLPVDETTEEFGTCTCFPEDTYALALRFLDGMARPVPETGNAPERRPQSTSSSSPPSPIPRIA